MVWWRSGHELRLVDRALLASVDVGIELPLLLGIQNAEGRCNEQHRQFTHTKLSVTCKVRTTNSYIAINSSSQIKLILGSMCSVLIIVHSTSSLVIYTGMADLSQLVV